MTPIRLFLAATLALPSLALAEEPRHKGDAEAKERHHKGNGEAKGRRHKGNGDTQGIMEKVRKQYPERFERLMLLRAEDPEAFRHALRRIRERMGASIDHEPAGSQEEKEAMRELHAKFKTALEAIIEANAHERSELELNLVELAGEIFDEKQANREERLETMRSRLSKLEQKITKQTEQRETLIDQFIEERRSAVLKGR
jgi:hypothetical protein